MKMTREQILIIWYQQINNWLYKKINYMSLIDLNKFYVKNQKFYYLTY